MKVLLTGANGQLGYALQSLKPTQIKNELLTLVALSRDDCDLENVDTLSATLDHYQPDAIINAAAYTAVDKAESEPELAHCINANAVKIMASWCQQKNIPFIHISTDFVFDGKKSSPYLPSDQTNPTSVYGSSKQQGEIYALEQCTTAYVVRTGWVYGEHGANFVKTILRLANEREYLNVIADQVGTPTYARNLAQMIWRLLAMCPTEKVHHFSDAGVASWYDFAVAIVEEAQRNGLLQRQLKINPIVTADYPTPACRPEYSVLNKAQTWRSLDLEPMHWRNALTQMLTEYKNSYLPLNGIK